MNRKRNNLKVFEMIALAMILLPILATPAAAQKKGPKTNSLILYHDGTLMPGASNVYFILYGNWEAPPPLEDNLATVALLQHLVIGLSGSPYLTINSTYTDYVGSAPNGGLVLGRTIGDLYSRGSILTDADVQDVVQDMIVTGWLPHDSRGIYVVLTSSDVSVDGFCTSWDQYHGFLTLIGTSLKYVVVGNPRRCPSTVRQFVAPDGTLLPTPNANFAADAMASSLAHAISGTVTNPEDLGWFDRYGLENSDKCQGTFGTTYATPNGARANMRLNGLDFLIQQNWVNSGRGYCGLSIR